MSGMLEIKSFTFGPFATNTYVVSNEQGNALLIDPACSNQYEQQQLELEKLSREAWQDWQGYRQQALQMQKKSEADSLAYSLTRRQFEEGLCTAIDLHTVRSQWLNSKAMLLQCRLMVMVKQQLVRYYNGETIWIE
jgi:outer membrane protein